jgi:phosphatidylinositol alpha-1,6-mannosyltransferase
MLRPSAVDVLFISKPIAPPFHDGSKCLVRDIATHLERATPVLLSTRGAEPVGANGHIRMVPVYGDSGRHAPSLRENLRAAGWVLARSRADLWHFVFAPNPRTSAVGRLLSGVRRKPVVQTIASPPRRFEGIGRLLFGDVVVAQSRWTADRVLIACERQGHALPDVRVIPPPVPTDIVRAPDVQLAARARLDIPPHAPLVIYPGDLEVSSGGRAALKIAERLQEQVPEAVVLFAYRRKTAASEVAADELRRNAPRNARFAATVPDVLAFVASAAAVIFPVDDLYGKVDVPIVLLEAMVLGVPVMVLGHGPLAELAGAEIQSSLEPETWVETLALWLSDEQRREARIAEQRARTLARCSAPTVARAYEDIYLELGEKRARVAAPSTHERGS